MTTTTTEDMSIPLPLTHITARRLRERVGEDAVVIPLHLPPGILADTQPAPMAYHVTAQGGPYLMTAFEAETYMEKPQVFQKVN